MPVLTEHPELKRLVRADDWDNLATGTYEKLLTAIEAGETETTRELAAFFLTEARVIFDIYTQWEADARRYLLDRGLSRAEYAAEAERLRVICAPEHSELLAEREMLWEELELKSAAITEAAQPAARSARASEMKDLWRHMHDTSVDFISGQFDIVVRRFGEAALGEMYEKWVIGDWFDKRYKRFDVSHFAWEDAFPLIVYLTFESMHGHLAGPGRLGNIDFESFDDRVVFTFAPCGSGGHTVAGEPLDGTGPRMEPPYSFKVLEEEHDFAWNMKGVCTYCAHCCVLTEKLPMERFGYPVRVVDPPIYDGSSDGHCRWTVYRDPSLVPEDVYNRLGMTKPAPGKALGSAAHPSAGEGSA